MNPVAVGKFIAKLRKEQNMTQEQLGDALGVTNKTVSRWESGNYMPGIEALQQLSQLFSVSINELLAGEYISNEDFRSQADQNLIDAVKTNSVSELPFRQIGVFFTVVFLCGFGLFILNAFFMDAASYHPAATSIAAVMMILSVLYYLVLFGLQIRHILKNMKQ